MSVPDLVVFGHLSSFQQKHKIGVCEKNLLFTHCWDRFCLFCHELRCLNTMKFGTDSTHLSVLVSKKSDFFDFLLFIKIR